VDLPAKCARAVRADPCRIGQQRGRIEAAAPAIHDALATATIARIELAFICRNSAGRTSCGISTAQDDGRFDLALMRLILHTAAYWLMLTVHDAIPRPTHSPSANSPPFACGL